MELVSAGMKKGEREDNLHQLFPFALLIKQHSLKSSPPLLQTKAALIIS